jgi:hypothetical protein
MQYIFVVFIYVLNAIIVHPMPSRTDASFIAAFTEVFNILQVRDYQPALNVMDNKCSKAVGKHTQSNKMEIQLVPPHNHRANATKRAIGTFKKHFVAALATADMLCPLQLWEKFLLQMELTLNLLRFSHRNPLISANYELYGPFDFNKTPLALLRTKALVYDDPATQTSWAPHATDGFYVGPTIDHYQCLCFYIPLTRRFRFSDTWRLYPTHYEIPILSKNDKTLLAAGDIFEQLGGTIPTTASAKMKHLAAIRQLTAIMSAQPDAPSLVPTATRVETATPPRVAVAAPLRVATTLNTITSLRTIRLLPSVHQCVARNNNPFQILSNDDNDKCDDVTVVASNCSPRTPLQVLHDNHVLPDVPTSMPWPPTCCLHFIQKPSPLLIPLPSAIPIITTRPTTQLLRTILPPNPELRPPPHVIPSPNPSTRRVKSPPTALPQTLLLVPPVEPSHVAHDLWPSTNKQARSTAPTAPPRYNIIDPNGNHHDQPITQSSTQPWRSTRITYPCMPGNISIQAMHHVMTLKASKVATNSQWTSPIINIKEH